MHMAKYAVQVPAAAAAEGAPPAPATALAPATAQEVACTPANYLGSTFKLLEHFRGAWKLGSIVSI